MSYEQYLQEDRERQIGSKVVKSAMMHEVREFGNEGAGLQLAIHAQTCLDRKPFAGHCYLCHPRS